MGDDQHGPLDVFVGITLTVVWGVIGISTIWTGNIQAFVTATAPFGVFIGGMFGYRIVKRAGESSSE